MKKGNKIAFTYVPFKHFLQLFRESFVQGAKEDHEMIRGAQNKKLPMSTTCKINEYYNNFFKFYNSI
jgi:hypothetical protein